MDEIRPVIGVIMGSKSDLPVLNPALDFFEAWDVPYEVIVASAHRTPDLVAAWLSEAEERGIQVIIAAAGGAAHLPGVVASKTLLPVIGVPIDSSPLKGQDALYAIVQMPPGIPVATVGIDASLNAAILSLHILARIEPQWGEVLREYRSGWAKKIDGQNAELKAERPEAAPFDAMGTGQSAWEGRSQGSPGEEAEIRSIDLSTPLQSRPEGGTSRRGSAGSGSVQVLEARGPAKIQRQPSFIGRVSVDSEFLAPELAEETTDCFLDGGIVAIPTDTVYGLAVDATNLQAVQALYELKGRDRSKPVALFIESPKQLAPLVRNLTTDVRQMLEAFWPGSLTVVFERRNDDFAHISPMPTLGVRLPNHSIVLALLQELHRPLACTSANPASAPEARSADEVEQYFGRGVHMILDAGKLERRPASTVIDVSETPYRIVREGAISRAQLAAVLGSRLRDDEGQ